MKITIPQPITLLDLDGKIVFDEKGNPSVVSFRQFVTTVLLSDPKFGRTMADILSAVEIKNRLAEAVETLELDKEDWKKLLAVTEEPSVGYNTVVATQLISFFLAIKNAK